MEAVYWIHMGQTEINVLPLSLHFTVALIFSSKNLPFLLAIVFWLSNLKV